MPMSRGRFVWAGVAALAGCASEEAIGKGQCVVIPAAEPEAPPDDWLPPQGPYELCPYDYTEVVCASREPELVFTEDELDFRPVMAWTGDGLVIGVQLEGGYMVDRRWGIVATVGATAEVATLWELPLENHPNAILPTPEGLFVVAKAYSSAVTGGLLRLHPDGSHERLFETPYSGLNYTSGLVYADGWIHGKMRDTPLGYASRPTRIRATGGELEVFDFTAPVSALVDGGFIGVWGSYGAAPCDHGPDCFPPLVSLSLGRHDLSTDTTTEIRRGICLTANPGYVQDRFTPRGFWGVGVHANGIVVDDGELVDIGLDGSHRVIAGLDAYTAWASLQGETIYLLSAWDSTAGEEFHALRRVSLHGGPIEELARFDGGNVEVAGLSDEHLYFERYTEDGRSLMRIAL